MSLEILPIKTSILTPKDDIAEVITRYAGSLITPNDLVAVAESVVAITQGNFAFADQIHVTPWARFLCRFVPDYGSLATPHGMQTLFNAEGTFRVSAAMAVGFLGKIIGKPGLFYSLGGYQAALIDDISGTMPPFDKSVVLGPKNPNQVVADISNATKPFGAIIADVNDLHRARIVAYSANVKPEAAANALLDNPFGNASQKQPICILKNFRQYQEERS